MLERTGVFNTMGWPPPDTCYSCAQGAFVDCASPAPVTATLATATMELLRSDHVHKHTQPYVRRAALVAAGQVGPAWSCSAAMLVLRRSCAQPLCSPNSASIVPLLKYRMLAPLQATVLLVCCSPPWKTIVPLLLRHSAACCLRPPGYCPRASMFLWQSSAPPLTLHLYNQGAHQYVVPLLMPSSRRALAGSLCHIRQAFVCRSCEPCPPPALLEQ